MYDRLVCIGRRCLYRGFCRLFDAGSFQRGDLDDFTAHLLAEFVCVDLVALFSHNVHHIDGHDDRNPQLYQLCGQVKVTLQIRAVYNIQDRVRPVRDQIISGDHFLQSVRGKGIDSGKVHDRHI